MLKRITRMFADLRGNASGNATMLVAMGMPVLIGSAGLGVDLAQWYMWKRELQFAVDQAAVAGAWARTSTNTENIFVERATQEFNANLSVTDDFATTPTVRLANFAGSLNNSVAVSATVSKALPFSNFLTGVQATIFAYAQASFQEGASFTSCLIAVDDDEDGAITIGGNSLLTAGCGMAALSDSEIAIRADGNPTVDAGWILARGGIDQWFKDNTDDIIMENMEGLFDPFDELTPPNPAETQVNRTYSCNSTSDTTTADYQTRTRVVYSYWEGSSKNGADQPYDWGSPKANSDVSVNTVGGIVPNGTVAGTVTSTSTYTNPNPVGGSGSHKVFERSTTTVTKTYNNVTVTPGQPAGHVIPGTYSGIRVSCDTTFATGVYVIDGGGIDITAQYEVTGSNVMFVLKNGAYIKIRGGSDSINLTAIQASDLIARGVPVEQANNLAGMLIFEDSNSQGSSHNEINGNVETVLNGILYFPVSNLTFSGTATVTSQCLMIAANTITLTGTTDMRTFCPEGSSEETVVANTVGKVRLVA